MFGRLLCAMLLCCFAGLPAMAASTDDRGVGPAEPSITPVSTKILTGTRAGCAFGNDAYPGDPLQNAASDAKRVTSALQTLSVKMAPLYTDMSRKVFFEKLADCRNFLEKSKAETIFIYYAGHSVTDFDKEQYLLPTDIDFNSKAGIKNIAVPIQSIVDDIWSVGARLMVFIWDGCRKNPWWQPPLQIGGQYIVQAAPRGEAWIGTRGGSQSSGSQEMPGVINVYATSPGDTATDSGTFASALTAALKKPDLEIGAVFREVRDAVIRQTYSGQIPWIAESRGAVELYLNGRQTEERLRREADARAQAEIARVRSEAEAKVRARIEPAIRAEAEARSSQALAEVVAQQKRIARDAVRRRTAVWVTSGIGLLGSAGLLTGGFVMEQRMENTLFFNQAKAESMQERTNLYYGLGYGGLALSLSVGATGFAIYPLNGGFQLRFTQLMW